VEKNTSRHKLPPQACSKISSSMLLQMAAQEAPHSSYNAPPRLLTAAPKQAQEQLKNNSLTLKEHSHSNA